MLGKFEIFMCQPEKARASQREPPQAIATPSQTKDLEPKND